MLTLIVIHVSTNYNQCSHQFVSMLTSIYIHATIDYYPCQHQLVSMLALLAQVFQVPRCPHKGTNKWIQQLIDSGQYTFGDMVTHEEIMQHFVRDRIRQAHASGQENGYPVRLEKEVIPTEEDIYECHEHRLYRKNATRPHREIPFMRGASADGAILELKNRCKYLVRVRAADMPTNQEWDNFAEVCD